MLSSSGGVGTGRRTVQPLPEIKIAKLKMISTEPIL